jgi:hypothetical protein
MGGCSEPGPSRRRLFTLGRVSVRAASRAPKECGPAPEGDGMDKPWSWARRSRAPGHSLRFLTGPRAGGRINSPWRSVQERKERRVVAHPFLEHDGPLAIATWPMPRPAGPPSERSSPLQHVLGRRNATLPITPRSSTAGSSLRWLRVVSGPIEVVEVVRHDPVVSDDPEDDQGGGTGELGERRGWRTRGG